MKRTVTITALLLFPLLASAEVYKCTNEDGRVAFSQDPCGAAESAETVDVQSSTTTGVNMGGSGDWSKVIEGNNEREIEREIERHQRVLRRLMDERDDKLAELRRQQSYANNNQAGATYRQSLATEMQAVSEDYNSRIRSEREIIRDLRNR